MALNGVKTTNQPSASTLDEVIGNKDGSTARQTMIALSTQIRASGEIATDLDDHEARIVAEEAATAIADARFDLLEGSTTYATILQETWAELAAITGSGEGQSAEVLDADTGTHTDPVVGGTVPNSGRFSWSVSPAGWKRIGDTALSGKADQSELDARIPTVAKMRITSRIPALVDTAGVPLIWYDNGLDAAAVSPRLLAAVTAGVSTVATQTTGRDQARFLSKAIAILQGGSDEVRFGVTGDSWAERANIAQALKSTIGTKLGMSGDGFFSANSAAETMTGYTVSATGWTLYDASSGTAPTRSCGPDGHAVYTTGTTDTWSVSGLDASRVRILYWDGDGAIRYRIDSGAWVEIAGGSTNAVAVAEVTGLTNAALVEIDTSTNTGTAEFYGVIADNPAASGVTVYKLGNGSSTGRTWEVVEAHLAAWSATLDLDTAVVILGTNDTRYGSDYPATLASGITSMVTALRSANATMGACYVAPPEHGDSLNGNGSFAEFRAAALTECEATGIDYVNAASRWLDYAAENAAGFWSGLLHMSDAGAGRLANYDLLPPIFREVAP